MDAVALGKLPLATPFLLSPLAGYTNLPFRRVIREIGGVGLCTTDLVNARSLLEKNRKALKLIETCAEDSPLAVQIFGSVPSEMADATRLLEDLGVASVDVNMGCPVRKVCGVGGGSAMMTELGRTAALVRGMIEAVRIPITCKMRLGWDDANLTAPDLARALEDAGAAAIMVHGRTRQQGFEGSVNLAGIRRVVEAVRTIPVFGNGDITSPQAAKVMLEATGCAGVTIGRGAFYNPWIRRAHRRDEPPSRSHDRGLRRTAWLCDVPQGGPVVRQTIRPRVVLQQGHRPHRDARRLRRAARTLSRLARPVRRRKRRPASPLRARRAAAQFPARGGRHPSRRPARKHSRSSRPQRALVKQDAAFGAVITGNRVYSAHLT
jgi:nifR3 family TIM-barrel protein